MKILDHLSSNWTRLSTAKKMLVIFLFVLFFLNSNITAINRGPCVSSPCGGESFSFSDSMVDIGSNPSYYIHTESNPILAPTSLLLLLTPYEKEVGFSFLQFLAIGFDNNPDHEIDKADDENRARVAYILVKAIILLSFPFWLLVSLLIVKKWYFIVPAILVLFIISFLSFFNLFVISDMGVTTATWNWLF
ncbi:hypothetical protein HN699_03100 [Candidatus Uhrbacteria bacterium]|nr:hypothetical protein [Candidatus Uhrbacteria bacterium]